MQLDLEDLHLVLMPEYKTHVFGLRLHVPTKPREPLKEEANKIQKCERKAAWPH